MNPEYVQPLSLEVELFSLFEMMQRSQFNPASV